MITCGLWSLVSYGVPTRLASVSTTIAGTTVPSAALPEIGFPDSST